MKTIKQSGGHSLIRMTFFQNMIMKKILLVLSFIQFTIFSIGQEKEVYQFKTIKDLESTEVKDQCNTGTCWSFSTTSFIESELIRMGKGNHDLSEMFNVRMTYPKKVERYLRYHGKAQFGPGSLCHDVTNVIAEFGLVPDEVYTGLDKENKIHNHDELDFLLEKMTKMALERKGGVSSKFQESIASILDVYLGSIPPEIQLPRKRIHSYKFPR